MPRSGADLALLLLGGYRTLVDAAVAELADRGFADVRPAHDFAMRAIQAGADTASDLGRQMSVTRQAAAKTIDVLLERGYVTREADLADGRRNRLAVTPLGAEVMRQGEAVFGNLRRRFERQIGKDKLKAFEEHLRLLVGETPLRLDAPGWVAHAL
jgi:DNA-binding MarR family transcriptional regulator